MKNAKNGASLGAIIGVAFAFMTTFFGGGWATGAQTGAYATQHGWTAIWAPLLGVAGICAVGWVIVEMGRLYNVWNYGDFMERFYGSKIVKVIFDVIQLCSMPISFSVCTATFGSTMSQACGGSVLVKNVIPRHLECITAKLREMSVEVTEFDDAVLVRREGRLTKTNIKTLPYPGFPTDMQPQMTTALCLAEGTSIITEGIWGSRYRYTEELSRMGANIHVDGAIAVVEGVKELNGAPVRAHDLRAGAAMVIAGLAAKGVTEVEQVQNIERGYETLVEKFVALGADMYRSEIPDGAESANRA